MCIDKIDICLEDYFSPYPTGTVAYDGPAVVDSEYCDTVEDFAEFFGRNKEGMFFGTRLVLKMELDSDHCDQNIVLAFADEVKKAFEKIRPPYPKGD